MIHRGSGIGDRGSGIGDRGSGIGERGTGYWIVTPPDGALVSLAPAMLAVACHTLPVVLSMKWRLPVLTAIGSAQVWNPEARFVAPLQAVKPLTDVPVIETV